jgi:hypothetical protein
MARNIICDHCGTTYSLARKHNARPLGWGTVRTHQRISEDEDGGMLNTETTQFELCSECMTLLQEFLKPD